jgi:hypothetical protein
VTLCGSLLGFATGAQAAEQAVGTVMGVPIWELDAFVRANALPGSNARGVSMPANDVTVLHVAPEFSSSIATVAITRRDNGQPARSVYFPTFGNRVMSRIYQQINAEDTWSVPELVGDNFNAVLKVEILQSPTGSYTPGQTRFLLVPAQFAPDIIAVNPQSRVRGVHRQRAHIGVGDQAVQLLAVESNGLLATDLVSIQIPGRTYGQDLARVIRSLNTNVTLQGIDVVGVGPMSMVPVR